MRFIPAALITGVACLLLGPCLLRAQVALVRHAPVLNGAVEGSIQQMLPENATLNSGASVSGDLLVPGTPAVRLNGKPSYGGTLDGSGGAVPTNYTITLNSGASLRHVVRRSNAVTVPAVSAPPPPAGTRSVSLNSPGQSPGNFATLKNLTLNSNAGQFAVPPGTYGSFTANSGAGFTLGVAGAAAPAVYNFQNLTLNSNSSLQVLGPVVVTVNGGFSPNATMGSGPHPEWLRLRIACGGLSVAGNKSVYAFLEAPDGTVTLNGGSQLIGGVASDRLIVNGNGLLRLVSPAANQPPGVSLTTPANGAALTAPASFTLMAAAADPDGTIAKVEFYQGTAKLGEDTVAPYTLPVSGLGAGGYSFTARAVDNLGATADSPVTSITVSPPAKPPPTVVLVAPGDNATYISPALVHLEATTDSAVAVARVEFYQGTTKLGEDSAAPYTYDWTNVGPGNYSLTARAIDNTGAAGTSPARTVTVMAGLPFVSDFEPGEGYVIGPLAGQGGWTATPGVTVTDADAAHGTRSVLLLGAQPPVGAAHTFAAVGGQPLVFLDFWILPAAGSEAGLASRFETEAFRGAFVRTGSTGVWQVLNGGNWQPAGPARPVGADGLAVNWVRVTLRADYSAKTWDMYIDGTLVAVGLSFSDSVAQHFSTFTVGGHPAAATLFDDFSASYGNPLFADADRDGMDDGWETAHGLNPAFDDREGDLDGDGLSNIREYLMGLSPNNPDSDGDGLYDGDEIALGRNPAVPSPDTHPPSTPANLATSAVTSDSVTLFWQPATDDLKVSGYLVYRDGQPVETDQPIRGTTFTDTGLPDGEEFTYQVRAFDYAGNVSPLGGEVTVATAPLDTDGDGLPDIWESRYFGTENVAPDADPDGDGLTNRQEFLAGSAPNDFYNGVLPVLENLYGGGPGPNGELAMIVHKPDGTPWPAAPVCFSVKTGQRRISAQPGGPEYVYRIEARADVTGLAKVYLEPMPP